MLTVALALPASAQEGFGLDLTDSTQSAPQPKPKPRKPKKPRVESPPAPPPEDSPAVSVEPSPAVNIDPSGGQFGLDLSTPSGPDMRPTLVVLGVAIKPVTEGASPSAADSALARQTSSTLLAEAGKEGRFRVITPDEAREKLGDGYEAALQCSEASCFEQALETLDAERALGAQLMVGGGQEVSLRLNGFSRGKGEVETTDVSSGGPPRPAFQQAIATDAQRLLGNLSTLLAQLKLTTNVPDATVKLGERVVGAGSIEKQVSAGRHTLRVAAAGHAPFERDITLEPGETTEVEVNLSSSVAKVPDYVDPDLELARGKKRSGPAPAFRPGWVVALGGVVAAAVGVGIGASAQAVASRATDANGDGVLDVTRQEILAARGNATLANVLVGAGGALVVGGGLWFLLAPAPATPAVALGGGGGGAGLQAVAGGTF